MTIASSVYLLGVLALSWRTSTSSSSCGRSNAWLRTLALSVLQCMSWIWFLERQKKIKPRTWYLTAVEGWAFWLAVDLSPGCSAEEYFPGYLFAVEFLLGIGMPLLRSSCAFLGIRTSGKAEAAFYAANAFACNSVGRPEYAYGVPFVALMAATKAAAYARIRSYDGGKRSNGDDASISWGSFLPHCTVVSVVPWAAIRLVQAWANGKPRVGEEPILPVHRPRYDSGGEQTATLGAYNKAGESARPSKNDDTLDVSDRVEKR